MKRQLANLLSLLLIVCCPLSSLAAEVLFYDTDNVGTPVAMWNTSGNKVWEGEYYPFGEEFRVTKSPADNKKHFVGKEKDAETGLTYFGARYMDETTGRFTSPDPVRVVDPFTSKTNSEIVANPQRLNRYVYGLNNPYRYVDPDGEYAVTATGEIEEIKAEVRKVSQTSIRNANIVVDIAMAVASEGMIQRGITSKGLTPWAARRQTMREAGIPTSQQPISQTSTKLPSTNQPGGRQYTYETPTSGGGTRQQSVQHSLTDRVEGHGPHWEAGPVKPRGQTDPLGRPRLQGQKVKTEE